MNTKIFYKSLKSYYEIILQVLNDSIFEKKMIISKGLNESDLEEKQKEEIKKILLNYIELLEVSIETTSFLLKSLKEFSNSTENSEGESNGQ
jgi:hypothetical protein